MKIDKPWGYEEILFTDEKYTVKRLFMKMGHRCSLQYHEHKQETIYVLTGVLRIMDKMLYAGEFITVYPEDTHRMEGVTNVLYLECSTSELNDVVRLSDDYGRA